MRCSLLPTFPLLIGALLYLLSCTEAPDGTSKPDEPLRFLDRLLLELDKGDPARAARVAAGFLTDTTTVAFEAVANRAIDWAAQCERPEPLTDVARALALRGAGGRLETLLDRTPARFVEEVRAEVILARAQMGELTFALGGLARIDAPELADRVRAGIIPALLRKDRISVVQAQIGRFHNPRRRDEALRELARAHAQRGRHQASEIAANAIQSAHLRDQAQAAIARVEHAQNRPRKAIQRATRIESKLIRAQTLADLAVLERKKGRRRRAMKLFKQAETEVRRIDDPFLLESALAYLAKRFEDAERRKAAQALLEELPSDRAAEVHAERARRWAEVGNLRAARRAAEDLRQSPGLIASDARAAVAALEARLGHLDRALEETAQISVPATRWRSLGRVAARLADVKLTDDQVAVMQSALRALP